MSELEFKRRASVSGEDKNVVLFLHGYGADGADLLGLAEPLAPHLPDTVFIAVDAPERSMANPMGFQWFPIPWIDGSSEVAAAEGLRRSAKALDGFIDKVLADEGSRLSEVSFWFVGGVHCPDSIRAVVRFPDGSNTSIEMDMIVQVKVIHVSQKVLVDFFRGRELGQMIW